MSKNLYRIRVTKGTSLTRTKSGEGLTADADFVVVANYLVRKFVFRFLYMGAIVEVPADVVTSLELTD